MKPFKNYNLQQFLKKFKHVRLASIVKNGWRKMVPATRLETVQSRLTETTEARLIIDSGQHVPFHGLEPNYPLASTSEKKA